MQIIGQSKERSLLVMSCPCKTISVEQKDIDSRLTESEIGRLALKISSRNIKEIGEIHLEYNTEKLDSIEDMRQGDKWFFKFEVFVNWMYRRKENNRKVPYSRL